MKKWRQGPSSLGLLNYYNKHKDKSNNLISADVIIDIQYRQSGFQQWKNYQEKVAGIEEDFKPCHRYRQELFKFTEGLTWLLEDRPGRCVCLA